MANGVSLWRVEWRWPNEGSPDEKLACEPCMNELQKQMQTAS
jgi:hypothetical protein